MDISKGLIAKLVDQDAFNLVTRSGINEEFLDAENASILNYIERYYSDYKKCPSRPAVLQAFPNYKFEDYEEPLEYFVDQIKEIYRRNVLEEALFDINRTYHSDSSVTENLIRETLGKLSTTNRTFRDVDLARSARERIENYFKRKESPPIDGVSTGWSKVDNCTLGWHAEEFIILVGERYSGKSWLMIWMAYQAMLQGERVLFATKEMAQDAMARRFDSILASVQFESLRRGQLSDVEEKRYIAKLEELHSSNYKFIFARDGVETISEIERKAIEVDATIIFVDSVYLFNPDSSNSFSGETPRRMEISKKCKGIARSLGIPLIASTQAGRLKNTKDPSLDDIQWSDQFSQDGDTVLRITKDEVDEELGRLGLHVLKARDGNKGAALIGTDFTYMKFEELQEDINPTTEIKIEDEETIFDG